MKARIVKEGSKYYVQTKTLWWWSYEEDCSVDWHGGYSTYRMSFQSLKDAQNHIDSIIPKREFIYYDQQHGGY